MTTLVGRFEGPEGGPVAGTVSFRLSHPIHRVAATIERTTVTVPLDDGRFDVELAPNEGAEPSGTVYEVTVAIYGAPTRRFSISVDDVPGPVELSQLAPAVPADPQVSYLTAAALADLTWEDL